MRGNTVLVVEGYAGIRDLIQMVLEEELGIHLVLAKDGQEALRLAQKTRPALVMLGVWPPELEALEVARHLKADPATRGIPVVALTYWREGRHEALEAGCDAFLDRPLDDIGRFIDKVREYLAKASGACRHLNTPGRPVVPAGLERDS